MSQSKFASVLIPTFDETARQYKVIRVPEMKDETELLEKNLAHHNVPKGLPPHENFIRTWLGKGQILTMSDNKNGVLATEIKPTPGQIDLLKTLNSKVFHQVKSTFAKHSFAPTMAGSISDLEAFAKEHEAILKEKKIASEKKVKAEKKTKEEPKSSVEKLVEKAAEEKMATVSSFKRANTPEIPEKKAKTRKSKKSVIASVVSLFM